ncbi:MAG: DUF3644 domain-containing protein [Erysipelotrichaceae bacterium]|nr:DUF3644 domain-containing protein [Erysipelotrichaceae bacterium]
MIDLKEKLIQKSIEAFILSLEIYNKPTIKYRIEGFSFFICNAWELTLKAKLLNDGNSIYFNNKSNRTLSLSDCIKKVYTNKNGNLRKNLEMIFELRNTSTHFIVEEYEQIYAPLFQASVQNFIEQTKKFHSIDISNHISQNFLTLSINVSSLNEKQLRAKYSEDIVSKLLSQEKKILDMEKDGNSEFHIPVATYFYITKDKSKSDMSICIDNDSQTKAKIIKEVKDPNNLYPYSTKDILRLINKTLKSNNILLTKEKNGLKIQSQFTSNDFQLFINFYNIKSNESYCFHFKMGNRFSYNQSVVTFIVNEIKSRPETIIYELKKGVSNSNKQ